ncbi:glycogen debranching N-terminal domain-containing protein [Microbacterium sp. W4I20]|uniref:glycogen debranching N-terminal domain-containing protein n=1 Tax=Microbacterium sp. W4I20 TaxID=3042262 RepID=UPI002781EFF4|nr:glycogen debranching N-terminal domain-containing protein [Microbacterium sp. W4I20]MDQ0728730.1 hypothetical protein [Microbacterium sp. W4I20]
MTTTSPPQPLQPLLDDAVIALEAPTQVWSDDAGLIGTAPIHGIYHGDVRQVRAVETAVDGTTLESIGCSSPTPGMLLLTDVLRGLDDDTADPKVRLDRERIVTAGNFSERWLIASHLETSTRVGVTVHLTPDFGPMQMVKAGMSGAADWEWDGEVCRAGQASFALTAPGATVSSDGERLTLRWDLEVAPRSTRDIEWTLVLADTSLVVGAPAHPAAPPLPDPVDSRAARWLQRASADLAALRLATPQHPEDAFYAAGAPWFFTLFGRDSLWTARLALAADPLMAASTLRVLARLQGTTHDPSTAEAPGKIPHELRSDTLSIPNEGVHLAPLYYGTVDATPLWVCLLADAREAGMPEHEVRALLPRSPGCAELGHRARRRIRQRLHRLRRRVGSRPRQSGLEGFRRFDPVA